MIDPRYQLAQDLTAIVREHRFSTLRIVVDRRRKHPFGVKHRLLYFARKANRHLEVHPSLSNHDGVTGLRVHQGIR